MSYEAKHYNAIFEAMRQQFGETWYEAVAPMWWNVWRKQIKEWFFDHDILISEMVAGIEEAAGKGRWPIGTSFFARLNDVCLKNRHEKRLSRLDGMSGLGDIMQRNHLIA